MFTPNEQTLLLMLVNTEIVKLKMAYNVSAESLTTLLSIKEKLMEDNQNEHN